MQPTTRYYSTESKADIAESNSFSTNVKPVYNQTPSTKMENPFEQLNNELHEVKLMLRQLLNEKYKPVEVPDLIGIKVLSEMIHLSCSTIYKMTANCKIPFSKRQGSKKLIFSRMEINEWLKESDIPTTNIVEEHLHMKLRMRKNHNC